MSTLTNAQIGAAMDSDQIMVRTPYGQWRLIVALYGDPEGTEGWVGTTNERNTWRMTEVANLAEMKVRL